LKLYHFLRGNANWLKNVVEELVDRYRDAGE